MQKLTLAWLLLSSVISCWSITNLLIRASISFSSGEFLDYVISRMPGHFQLPLPSQRSPRSPVQPSGSLSRSKIDRIAPVVAMSRTSRLASGPPMMAERLYSFCNAICQNDSGSSGVFHCPAPVHIHPFFFSFAWNNW